MKYTSYTSWAAYKEFFTQQFTMEESYVICGAGNGFQSLIQLFPDIKIRCCLDKNAAQISLEKWNSCHVQSCHQCEDDFGEIVPASHTISGLTAEHQTPLPYESLKECDAAKMKYIITPGCEYYSEIKNTLFHYGVPESHICSLPEIFHFWGQQYYGKTFMNSCSAILLTNCNLRCRSCSQLVPYIKHYRYNSAETVIKNLDQFFRIFDYIKELELIGGETMLYRELPQVFKYVREHFSDRYHELKIYTNGLMVPQEEVFAELAKLERVQVLISDYTCSTKKEPSVLIEYLKKYQIPYMLNNAFGQSSEYRWFDFGDPSVRKNGDTGERFQKCSLICQSLIDQKIYYCAPSCSASIGNITELDEPEYCLDLPELERLSPAERADQIGKFNLGFPDRGYLEFCKFCNGFGADINQHYVIAGEQC